MFLKQTKQTDWSVSLKWPVSVSTFKLKLIKKCRELLLHDRDSNSNHSKVIYATFLDVTH